MVPVVSRQDIRHVRWLPIAGEEADAAFDPFRRNDAPTDSDEEASPMPLKEQGSRSRPSGARADGDVHRRSGIADTVSTQSNRGGASAAVHHGLEFMFEAQQVRSDRYGSVYATRAGRRDDVRLPRSEFRISSLHRQTGGTPSSVAVPARNVRSRQPSRDLQWPTKCSSTRPIRRKPGWSSCAATASKNSISSPRSASN